MFTGIVQAVANIVAVSDDDGIRTFVIDFPDGFCTDLSVGGSVSIDGVCLTATEMPRVNRVSFDVVLQSLSVTALGTYGDGYHVNAERASKAGAEIGGHPLSGHVDFVSEIKGVATQGRNKVLRIDLPPQFGQYVFSKGYIAVNGTSLTVAEIDKSNEWFEVWLIPETRRSTVLDGKRAGDLLNIEIERGTQVVVDTIRDAASKSLGQLQPVLENLLREKGLSLESLVDACRLVELPSNIGAEDATSDVLRSLPRRRPE